VGKNKKNRKVSKLLNRKNMILFLVFLLAGVITFLLLGYIQTENNKKLIQEEAEKSKVLTVNDLINPDVSLTSDTSDTSVENIANGLKSQIDKQIAAKENPIDTVKELAGVLSNTTNEKRQDQPSSFLEDFLANRKDTLWFDDSNSTPDQAQVNYWTADLYACLVYNFQNIMENKFTDADGKPIDTTKEQLKYIDLYLAIANDPASHPPIADQDKDAVVGYIYREVNDFSELKNRLTTGVATQ